MATVVITKRAGTKSRKGNARSTSVGEKRVRDATGKFVTVRTLDGNSKTLGKDLTYVFTRNVAKARRENKRVTGTSDRAPAKA